MFNVNFVHRTNVEFSIIDFMYFLCFICSFTCKNYTKSYIFDKSIEDF